MLKHRQTKPYCFVSCDIVGHGFDSKFEEQVWRVKDLNTIIQSFIEADTDFTPIWSSGGDGGHLAIDMQSGVSLVLDLIIELRNWATKKRVPLRIAGHYGSVASFIGADGRIQLVGDGINMCANILSFGSHSSVVVSSDFRRLIEQAQPSQVCFSCPITVYIKQRAPCTLHLLSIKKKFDSTWGSPSRNDRELLKKTQVDLEKLDRGETLLFENLNESYRGKDICRILTWKIIYHVKRLLQVDGNDKFAFEALEEIVLRDDLTKLFAQWDPTTFAKFVKSSQLIERKHGELFCQEGDKGDAMFVILTGQIGIVVSTEFGSQELDIRLGAGEIAGELAVALRRDRTATLQAIGYTSALSFSYDDRKLFFVEEPYIGKVQQIFDNFFDERISEFLCNHASYFVGMQGDGPFKDIKKEKRERYIYHGLSVLEYGNGAAITPDLEEFSKNGLFILASGRLECKVGTREKVLDARDGLPIIYVEFDGYLSVRNHNYKVIGNRDAIILHVNENTIKALDQDGELMLVEQLVKAVKKSLLAQFRFDVFLSYNRQDREIAETWKNLMEESGVRVYLNEPKIGEHFTPELKSALLDSICLVPILTRHIEAAEPGEAKSWVEMEIGFRRHLFNFETNLLPILCEGGDLNILRDFSHIEASGNTDCEVVAKIVSSLNNRSELIPYSSNRVQPGLSFTDI